MVIEHSRNHRERYCREIVSRSILIIVSIKVERHSPRRPMNATHNQAFTSHSSFHWIRPEQQRGRGSTFSISQVRIDPSRARGACARFVNSFAFDRSDDSASDPHKRPRSRCILCEFFWITFHQNKKCPV